MLPGDDRVRGGVFQLQDMRNVYQNSILASALCFDPSLQDHFRAAKQASIGENAIPFPTSLDHTTLRLCRQM